MGFHVVWVFYIIKSWMYDKDIQMADKYHCIRRYQIVEEELA